MDSCGISKFIHSLIPCEILYENIRSNSVIQKFRTNKLLITIIVIVIIYITQTLKVFHAIIVSLIIATFDCYASLFFLLYKISSFVSTGLYLVFMRTLTSVLSCWSNGTTKLIFLTIISSNIFLYVTLTTVHFGKFISSYKIYLHVLIDYILLMMPRIY